MSNNLSSVVTLYVSTCRLAILASGSVESGEIVQNEIETEETNVNNNNNHNHTNQSHRNHFNTHWNELNRLMPSLRQALTCCHCTRIASDPVTIIKQSKTDDYGRSDVVETGLKCRICAKRNHLTNVSLVDNLQGKILIQCYRKLCQYLESTSFYRKLGTNGGTKGSLANLIGEGAAIEDDEDEIEECPTPLVGTSLLSRLLASPPMTEPPISNGLSSRGSQQISSNDNNNGVQVYSVSMDCDYGTRITIKRKPRLSSSSSISSSSSSSNDSLPLAYTVSRSSAYYKQAKSVKTVTTTITNKKAESVKDESKAKTTTNALRICRCGNATNQPGKLTCCGQRCPCYVDRRPCVRCKCRGCKNPTKSKDDEPQPITKFVSSTSPSSSSCSSSTVSLCGRARDAVVSEVVPRRPQKTATKRKAVEHNNET